MARTNVAAPEISLDNVAFNWQQSKAQIVVTGILMHGDAEAFTTHAVCFERSAEGRQAAAKLILVLELLAKLIKKKADASFEDICADLAKATKISIDELESMIAGFVIYDAVDGGGQGYEDVSALLVAYTLTETDLGGRVMHARFEQGSGKKKELVGYKRLISTVNERCLEAWA